MSLDIHSATTSDAEWLTALARDTFVAAFAATNTARDMALYVQQAFTVDTIRRELADTASTFLWAEHDGIPVGYARLLRGVADDCVTGAPAVELQRLYTVAGCIGAGVGKALLGCVKKLAQAEGFETLWLGVWEHNGRALEFYRRQGFVDVGEHPFLLGTDPQTDRVMQLDLRP